jgi:hypothetical protein
VFKSFSKELGHALCPFSLSFSLSLTRAAPSLRSPVSHRLPRVVSPHLPLSLSPLAFPSRVTSSSRLPVVLSIASPPTGTHRLASPCLSPSPPLTSVQSQSALNPRCRRLRTLCPAPPLRPRSSRLNASLRHPAPYPPFHACLTPCASLCGLPRASYCSSSTAVLVLVAFLVSAIARPLRYSLSFFVAFPLSKRARHIS